MSNDIFTKLSKFALVMSIVGLCTIGICPAFGVMGITVGLVFKYKGVKLEENNAKKIKIATILGIISLVLFVVDIIVLSQFTK